MYNSVTEEAGKRTKEQMIQGTEAI